MIGLRIGGVVLVFAVGLSTGPLLAATCTPPGTTVFFVNGLNNTLMDATASRAALAQRVGDAIREECASVALAYNLTASPFAFDPLVVDAHLQAYRAELAAGRKVVLVAHSNGNVYADEAYKKLGPAERSSLGVVAVATLLPSVPGDGPYVTLLEDTVIGLIPGHLPANTTNTGGTCVEGLGCHEFVRFYLDGQQSGPKIVQAVGDSVARLVLPAVTSVALGLNQTVFHSGETLRVALRARNPGPAFSADFYFGRLWPDGSTVTFYTSLAPVDSVTVTTSQPEGFRPLVRNVQVPQGLDVTVPDLLVVTLPSGVTPGTSVFFAAMTAPATLNVVAPIGSAGLTLAP